MYYIHFSHHNYICFSVVFTVLIGLLFIALQDVMVYLFTSDRYAVLSCILFATSLSFIRFSVIHTSFLPVFVSHVIGVACLSKKKQPARQLSLHASITFIRQHHYSSTQSALLSRIFYFLNVSYSLLWELILYVGLLKFLRRSSQSLETSIDYLP